MACLEQPRTWPALQVQFRSKKKSGGLLPIHLVIKFMKAS